MGMPVKYSHDLNAPLIFYSDCSLTPSPNCSASPARGIVTVHLFLQDAIFFPVGTQSVLLKQDSPNHTTILKGLLD